MRFIHITDTHIGPSPAFRLYGRDPFANLVQLVDRIVDIPFDYDFVIHTGDVTDDGSADSYRLFKSQIDRLRKPVRYVIGNHDQLQPMRDVLFPLRDVLFPPRDVLFPLRDSSLNESIGPSARLDYTFDHAGIDFTVLDTRGPTDPGGHLDDEQLARLSEQCNAKSSRPLVLFIHHQPVPLDTPWLDLGGKSWTPGRFMRMDNGEAFLRAISPAGPSGTNRLRGVFLGHVHTPFHITRDGISFTTAPSSFAQLTTDPNHDDVIPTPDVPVGFNIVTIEGPQTLVRSVRYPAV